MPERSSGGFGGDLLAISWQVAIAVAVPLFGAAWLSQNLTHDTGGQLAIMLGGLTLAGVGMFIVIRRFIALNPAVPTSDAAREAGQRWDREIEEDRRKKEADEAQ